jgi:hypothetical protein
VTGLDHALDLRGALVLPDGRLVAEADAPFQRTDARVVLDPEAPPNTLILRRRGGSKTEDCAGYALAACVALFPKSSRLYATAADRDQARLLLDSVAGFVHRTPILRDRFQVGAWRAVDTVTGSEIIVLAADAASSWGLRPSMVICDELCWWADTAGSRTFYESLTSSAAKIGHSKLVAMSTPSSPTHFSYKIFKHAGSDPMWNLLWTKAQPPWLDPEKDAEQRRALDPVMVARLLDAEWAAGSEQLTTAEDLARCVTLDGPLDPQDGRSYVHALDVGLVNDRTVVVTAHGEAVVGDDGERRTKVVLDRLRAWQGSRGKPVRLDDIESYMHEVNRAYRGRCVVDPYQAVQLTQRLRDRGLTVRDFTFTSASASKLAVTLHGLIRNTLLAIPDDADLIDELVATKLKETAPGVLRLDHESQRHDDRAVALAMAAHEIVTTPDTYVDAVPWALDRISPWALSDRTDPQMYAAQSNSEPLSVWSF